MKKLVLIMTGLFLIGCGEERTSEGIDPSFEPYLAELSEMALQYTGKALIVDGLAINFRPLNNGFWGICKKETREIFVDPDRWNTLNERPNTRLALLLHEIGHCSYFRAHDNSYHLDEHNHEAPNSIMADKGGPLMSTFSLHIKKSSLLSF